MCWTKIDDTKSEDRFQWPILEKVEYYLVLLKRQSTAPIFIFLQFRTSFLQLLLKMYHLISPHQCEWLFQEVFPAPCICPWERYRHILQLYPAAKTHFPLRNSTLPRAHLLRLLSELGRWSMDFFCFIHGEQQERKCWFQRDNLLKDLRYLLCEAQSCETGLERNSRALLDRCENPICLAHVQHNKRSLRSLLEKWRVLLRCVTWFNICAHLTTFLLPWPVCWHR